MPDVLTRIGPLAAPTFTVFLALGAVVTWTVALWRARTGATPGQLTDVCLGALIGAVAGARAVHVALNWSYFSTHTDEAIRLSAGGLDWHGAVIGGLIGLLLAARLSHVASSRMLDALSLALPLVAMAGWYGCWAAACGYGAEVDTLARYPAWAVAETGDVYGIVAPRYSTQVFGLALGAATLVIAAALTRVRGLRFWIVLALLSAGMAGIGVVRGDYAPVINGLRADQWLDLGMIGLCAVMIVRQITRRGNQQKRA